MEYVIESPDGSQRREWRKPAPDVEQLKVRILEVLAAEGKELLTLNAAMYAADKSDRIAAVRVELRDRRARQVIASYAGLKAVAVAFNPVAVADVLGGTAVDMTMVVTLAHIYGLELSTMHARSLIASIVKAAGWVMLGEMTTHVLSSSFKGLTSATDGVDGGPAGGRGRLRLVRRRPGGEILFRTRCVVGWRGSEDGRPPHLAGDRQVLRPRTTEGARSEPRCV